jgi:hypothetical protein
VIGREGADLLYREWLRHMEERRRMDVDMNTLGGLIVDSIHLHQLLDAQMRIEALRPPAPIVVKAIRTAIERQAPPEVQDADKHSVGEFAPNAEKGK